LSKQHLILNLGLARCGTTATAALFSQMPGMSTPEGIKELKFFLAAADPQSYRGLFTNPQGPVLFESSPPYMGGGTERFAQVMARAQAMTGQGFEVTVLIVMRNLINRAFSHYWHDIAVHYAAYGRYWSVKTAEDPRRFTRLYETDFLAELSQPKADAKFQPKVAQMLDMAIATFGAERVRIGHTAGLDTALADLFSQLGLTHRFALTPTPRLRGSRAPLFLEAGSSGSEVTITTRNGPREVTIPAGHGLLLRDHSVELLSDLHHDIARIAAASRRWTRRLETHELPQRVLEYLHRQKRSIARLPKQCFLAGQRQAILQDIAALPARLEITEAEPQADLLLKAFGG
jgi:hypothetical protein